MKTLAELKRDLRVGKKLTLTYHHLGKCNILNKKREIIKIQTNAIVLKTENKSGKSWLDLPPSSLLEYNDNIIKIYGCGERDLTSEEKKILGNMPSKRQENAKIVERDLLTDGSTSFWMDKKYLNDNNANWYWGWDKGKRFNHNTQKMYDKKIKGRLELQYSIDN